jgi:predicted Zn-dependent protease
MGRQSDEAVVAQFGLYPDSSVQRYVRELGLELAAVSERPELPWTFRVLDDPTVNAFALPGGFVYITRGIMAHMTNEAQLVGVLGHEIGHITARHSVNQMSRSQLAQLGLGLGAVFSETIRQNMGLASGLTGVLFLKFSRDDERESDRLGVRYMTRIGYDPAALAGVMQVLDRASDLSGGGRIPEWQSTHPNPANRSEAILQMAREEGTRDATTLRRQAFLGHLDGMTFGDDPREGYVEDGTFHHPELAFRLESRGWSVLNQKQQVQFLAPEEDAAVILTLAGAGPREAAASFAAQDGVRAGTARNTAINGLEAVSLPVELSVENGSLRGEAVFVALDGNTVRLLAIAPPSAWPSRRATAQAIQESFRRETDPQVLAVEPARIDLVRLERSLSFVDYVARYPSTVERDRVALINQVESGDRLDPGVWKRVVGGR